MILSFIMRILLLVLVASSGFVFADYSAVPSSPSCGTPAGGCPVSFTSSCGTGSYLGRDTLCCSGSTGAKCYGAFVTSYACPNGGVLSGTNCVTATASPCPDTGAVPSSCSSGQSLSGAPGPPLATCTGAYMVWTCKASSGPCPSGNNDVMVCGGAGTHSQAVYYPGPPGCPPYYASECVLDTTPKCTPPLALSAASNTCVPLSSLDNTNNPTGTPTGTPGKGGGSGTGTPGTGGTGGTGGSGGKSGTGGTGNSGGGGGEGGLGGSGGSGGSGGEGGAAGSGGQGGAGGSGVGGQGGAGGSAGVGGKGGDGGTCTDCAKEGTLESLVNAVKSTPDGSQLDPSGITDNPQDEKLSDDKVDDKKVAPDAQVKVGAAFDRVLTSADSLSGRSGIKSYMQGFFPSGSGGGGCAPAFSVKVPVFGYVEILIPCAIIRIIGDCIFMLGLVKAFSIAREGN